MLVEGTMLSSSIEGSLSLLSRPSPPWSSVDISLPLEKVGRHTESDPTSPEWMHPLPLLLGLAWSWSTEVTVHCVSLRTNPLAAVPTGWRFVEILWNPSSSCWSPVCISTPNLPWHSPLLECVQLLLWFSWPDSTPRAELPDLIVVLSVDFPLWKAIAVRLSISSRTCTFVHFAANVSKARLDSVILSAIGSLIGLPYNAQLPQYFSFKPDPGAVAVDAFTQDWSGLTRCAFPPFLMVGRCLQKIREEKVEKAVIVIPLWRSQAWYPLLASAFPAFFPQSKDDTLLVIPLDKGNLVQRNYSVVAVTTVS